MTSFETIFDHVNNGVAVPNTYSQDQEKKILTCFKLPKYLPQIHAVSMFVKWIDYEWKKIVFKTICEMKWNDFELKQLETAICQMSQVTQI